LADFRFYRQTRKYGENTDKSDLDILVDGPAGTPFTILPRSRWNWRLTKGFMASNVLNRAKIDPILMP
jgi:hypothetical protein